MFFGKTEQGIYTDDCQDIHPDVINQYYGIHGQQINRPPGETGAGHPSDEVDDETDWVDVGERVGLDQDAQIRHDAVEAPETADPFGTPELRGMFDAALTAVREQELVPVGYGILEGEWEDGTYTSVETIRSGRRGTKEIVVSLPDFLWRPKAVIWCQALDLLTRMEHAYGNITL